MKMDLKEMLASLYGLGVDGKNFFYDTGLVDALKVRPAVLSVGNLSVGGTGKTPVVQKILEMVQSRGISASVVSRNYKAQSRGVQKVDVNSSEGAFYYGDEAFLIARSFPSFSVWTGPKKFITAQVASMQESSQLLVVDDGFQHRSLHRDFDIVLLDTTVEESEDFLLPVGRLREGYSSLQRASAVILTKVNWSHSEQVENLKKKIPSGLPVYELEFHLRPLKPLETGAPVALVSGIAKPKVFEASIRQLGFQIREHLIFSDHHPYSVRDRQRILETFRFSGAQQILTTEKDFYKLQTDLELAQVLNPVGIQTEFRAEPKELHVFLDSCHRH
ncbi:MAG: tetraacyldisaccharide 4'-kinase [Pseudobdellovibrionaceae bacterium]